MREASAGSRAALGLTLGLVCIAGCGGSSKAAVMKRCAGLQPDTVTAVRVIAFSGDGFRPLDVVRKDPGVAQRFFSGVCVTEEHHAEIKGPVACPADFGLSYHGRFTTNGQVDATYDWYASGCQRLSLTFPDGKTFHTDLVAAASVASAPMDRAFRDVIGARCVAEIYEPPRFACQR